MNPNTKPAAGCECNLHPEQLLVQVYIEVLLKEHNCIHTFNQFLVQFVNNSQC